MLCIVGNDLREMGKKTTVFQEERRDHYVNEYSTCARVRRGF